MAAEATVEIQGDVYDIHSAQSKAFGSEYIPKVRKPYIMSKQREKWTLEEHERFLQALRLYGRSWRQIEEHVATKTAIQIRSHAQKYFDKVIRKKLKPLNPIEIPPPRHKKKPLHPYPRKATNHPIKNGERNAKPDDQSRPLILNGVERDTRSPTSVFSTVGSDTSGSPLSEPPPPPPPPRLSHFLPASCATDDAHSFDDDDDEEEERCLEPVEVTPPAMNRPVIVREPETTDESPKTFKLFGRTIIINQSQNLPSSTTEDNEAILKDTAEEDKVRNGNGQANINQSQNLSSSTTEDNETILKDTAEEDKVRNGNGQAIINQSQNLSSSTTEDNETILKDTAEEDKVRNGNGQANIQSFPAPNVDPRYDYGFFQGTFTPLSCHVPHYGMSEQCGNAGVVSDGILCLGIFKRAVFSQFPSGSNPIAAEPPCRKTEQETKQREEGSPNSSHHSSEVDVDVDVDELKTKSNDIESEAASKTLKEGSATNKGLTPYKRCFTERDVTYPIVYHHKKRKGREARVCQ